MASLIRKALYSFFASCRKCLTTIGCINSCMLDNYHKWDQVFFLHIFIFMPPIDWKPNRKHWFCSGGRMCLYLRDDPWLRKWGEFFSIYFFQPTLLIVAPTLLLTPSFRFLYLSSRSSTTSSTACLTMEHWNSIHRFDKHCVYIEHRACTIIRPILQRQDGPCKGDDSDAVTNVKTMDDIEGDW